jgi:hypothetical protein
MIKKKNNILNKYTQYLYSFLTFRLDSIDPDWRSQDAKEPTEG